MSTDPESILPQQSQIPEDQSRSPQDNDTLSEPHKPASVRLAESAGRVLAVPAVIRAARRRTADEARSLAAQAEKDKKSAQKDSAEAGERLLTELREEKAAEVALGGLNRAARRAKRAKGNAIAADEKTETADARAREARALGELRAARDEASGYRNVGLDELMSLDGEQPVPEIQRTDPVTPPSPEFLFRDFTQAELDGVQAEVDTRLEALRTRAAAAHMPFDELATRRRLQRELLQWRGASGNGSIVDGGHGDSNDLEDPDESVSREEDLLRRRADLWSEVFGASTSSPSTGEPSLEVTGGEGSRDKYSPENPPPSGEPEHADSSEQDEPQEREIVDSVQRELRRLATPERPQDRWNLRQRTYFFSLPEEQQIAWNKAYEQGSFDDFE